MHTTPIPFALLALAPIAAAQNPVVVVRDGDVIAGIGAVTSIDNLAVNQSGSWIVELDTDHPTTTADGLLLKDGVVHVRHGDALPLPAGATVSSFGTISLNAAGESTWNFFLGNAAPFDSGIYFGTTLVIREGDNPTSPAFGPGSVYTGFFGTKFNDQRESLIVASYDDPATAPTTERAMVVAQVDALGGLLLETVLYKEGDAIPGLGGETVEDFGTGPHEFALNDAGVALYSANVTGGTTLDGVIVRGTTVVAREGDLSPVPGRAYETLYERHLDINHSSEWVVLANLDGATTDDDVIVKNGSIVIAREGGNVPGLPQFQITSFGTGPVRIDSSGDVYWYADWNDPDTTRDTGIFKNDQLLVQEGVTTTSTGIVIRSISAVQDAFTISIDGRYLMFEGTLPGTPVLDAAFLFDLGLSATPYCFGDGSATACPCGNVGATGNGCASSLAPGGANLAASGISSLSADTLVLSGSSMPNSSALYFQGTTQQAGGLGVVFGDGLRCAGGSVVRLATKFNVAGASQFPVGGDPSVSVRGLVSAPGTRNYQVWYRNAAVFCTTSTFNLTNGISIRWAP